MFRELGFNARVRAIQANDRQAINEKHARRKTLYEVYVDTNPSEIVRFAQVVGFRCAMKRKLLEFFILTAPLPPRTRFKLFLEHWAKVDGKWKLSKPLECEEHLQPQRQRKASAMRRQKRVYIVKCPVCWKPGVFTSLHREVSEGKIIIQIRVYHGNEVCMLNLAEKEIKESAEQSLLIMCKCGRPGYIHLYTEKRDSHEYLRFKVCHHISGRKTKSCSLISLNLIATLNTERENSPNPPLRAHQP